MWLPTFPSAICWRDCSCYWIDLASLSKIRGFLGGSDLPHVGIVDFWKRICRQCGRLRFDPWVGKIPWKREWLPTPVFLSVESHGQRRLAGYSPWDHKESETAERLTLFTFSKISSHRCLGFFLDSQLCFNVFCSLHCFDYYNFVLSSEIGKWGFIAFFFLRLLWLIEASYNSIGI